MRATRKDAWGEGELQVLYDLVNDLEWFDFAIEQLPGRSENAIRTKMSLLRREAGIIPYHRGAKAKSRLAVTADSAKAGSDRLRRAIEAATA